MIDSKYIAGPDITEVEIQIVTDMMRNGWYNYDYVEKFEKEFAEYHNRKYGIMTPNCTSAIHLLLIAFNIGEGDNVIIPDFTWIGSSAGINYVGAETRFVDIEYDTWCISPQSIIENITHSTQAIIAVDIYGNMPDMDQLEDLSSYYQIPLIEDAAEGVGSVYRGRKAGNFGAASVFSFHRTKTITTGEGGIIVTDDEYLYERCRFLRDHGRPANGKLYYNYEVTPKYMPSNLQASVGYAQLTRVDELIEKKRDILQMYRDQLSNVQDIQLNIEPDGGRNSGWVVALLIGNRYNIKKEEMMSDMKQRGIETRPFFYPLSSLPAYSHNPFNDNPVAYDIGNRGVCLPSAFIVEEKHIIETCGAIRSILNGE